VNVPLNDTGMKNEDYMAIIHYLLIPLATEVINSSKKKLPTKITNTNHRYLPTWLNNNLFQFI